MPRSTRSLLVAACCLFISLPSLASRQQTDAFLARQPNQSLALTDEQLSARGISVDSTEARLGVPTFVTVAPGSAIASPLNAEAPVDQAARAHLLKVADVFRLDSKAVSDAQLKSVHDTGFGGVIARFNQRVDGIQVFRSELNVLMTRQRELTAVSGYLAPSSMIDQAKGTARSAFLLRDTEAVSVAYNELTGAHAQGSAFEQLSLSGDYAKFAKTGSEGPALDRPARSKKVFFILPEGLQAGYYVELFANVNGESRAESFVVSARDGQILFRNDLSADVASTYKVFASATDLYPLDSPAGNDVSPKATATPDRYQAPLLPPNSVTLQNFPFSRNDPWLPAGATTTTGNNVDAYLDAVAPDGFNPNTNDLRPANTGANTFDYAYDTTLAPNANATNKSAAVVNLFYVTNFLHDWWYDFGFAEQDGNGQLSNFGRGGLEGDSLKIEGQDNSGRNNANMSTPSDGSSPRMQQYIFDGVPLLKVTAPASLAANYDTGSAAFGASTYDLSGTVKIPNPAGTTIGCTAFAAGTFTGQIAVLDRGTCTFKTKAKNAQDAGAIALILVNNTANVAPPGMADDATITGVTIPTVSVSLETGNAWKAEVVANSSTIAVQMKKTADLDRDSAIDNTIVEHEWGHYISNRLIVDANGLSNNMGRSMGEGWADFNAMLVTVRAEDVTKPGNNTWQGVYPLATYTSSGGANNGYYYGIRRVPYSTDLTKNALSFRHFGVASPLPSTHPVNSGLSGFANSEVHDSGEVWATMLWECYASLLNAYPFAEAQNRMKNYLSAAFKMTPAAPTPIEARDAVLAAAQAADPADYTRFVAAFAKRGMGFGAKIGDRGAKDHYGVVESTSTTSALEVTSARLDDSVVGCDGDGVLDVGETGLLTVTVKNVGGTALSAFNGTVTASGATSTLTFPNGNTLSFPALARGASATRTMQVALSATTGTGIPTAGLSIAFNEPTLPTAYQTYGFDPAVHYDSSTGATAATETFDNGFGGWTSNGFTLEKASGNTYAVGHANDGTTDATLTSPWINVNATGNFTFSFKRRWTFEANVTDAAPWAAPYYDGAVVELTDDGITWYDLLNDLGKNPGYNNYLEAGGTNPLADRPAMVGISTGYPAFGTTNVNLGTIVAGSKIKIRFRVGADEAVGSNGLAVDDFTVTNAVTPPFSTRGLETSNGTVCNHRPVAKAGAGQTVPEYDVNNGVYTLHNVQLNGTGSFDADGSALTYQWTQISGPTMTLVGGTTATPTFSGNVDADSIISFQLVVNDGTESSVPSTVDVLVRNVNQKPVAVATVASATVPERSVATVTLDGTTSSDPDDVGPTAWTWTQTAGPTVTLTGADTATASFALPEVTADTVFTFKLVVNDGIDDSDPATVSVTVTNVDRAPVANAGTALSVPGRSAVQLTGTATDPDGDAPTFAWTQTAGPTVTLTGADTATPTFASPDVKTQTTLTFQLIASANGLNSAPATVDVSVAPDKAPTAIAGGDRAVPGRTAVQLTGSGFDPEGDALTYAWSQVGGPNVTLTNATTATVSFTSPDVKQAATLNFKLIVSANGLSSAPSFVNVAVAPDTAPVAVTAGDLTVNANAQVTLSGSGSDAEGDTLNYKWTQITGPSVALQNSGAASTTFFAPGGTTELQFTFQVFANELSSAPVTLNVHVVGDKAVPTVTVASAEISADEKTLVKLEATGTPGTEGDSLKYAWEQRGGDAVTLTDATSATASFTAPDVTGGKSYVFAVTATDSAGLSSAPAIVVVNVKDLDTAKTSGCGCTSGSSGLVPFAALFAMLWFRRRKFVA